MATSMQQQLEAAHKEVSDARQQFTEAEKLNQDYARILADLKLPKRWLVQYMYMYKTVYQM